jgi:hypothetical protein
MTIVNLLKLRNQFVNAGTATIGKAQKNHKGRILQSNNRSRMHQENIKRSKIDPFGVCQPSIEKNLSINSIGLRR